MTLLLGWQFTLAEFIGGPIMILILAVLFKKFLTPKILSAASKQAEKGIVGRMEGHAEMQMDIKTKGTVFQKLLSEEGKTAISHFFVMDWASVWTDIVLGLLFAGAIAAWVPVSFFQKFFFSSQPLVSAIWGPLVGPLIAVITFVCSIGNVPLAVVLWNGGISFGGVISFIFADLIVLPILMIYKKYYGLQMTAFLFVTFYVAMVIAGYLVEIIFALLRITPETRNITILHTAITFNYTTVLNIIFILIAIALVWRFLKTGGPKMLKMMNHHH
jgi:uncharacterized membrane protein YraQ (UPF0718 family)